MSLALGDITVKTLLRRISEIVGGKRGRVVRNMYKGHMDKAQGRWDQGWEVGMAGIGGSSGGKMETTVLEH